MTTLAQELLVSTGLVATTVVLHLVGLDLLMSLVSLHLKRFTTAWLHLDRLLVPLGIVLGLFVLHGVEIWIYAFAYLFLGLLPTIEQALYFSANAYSTVGEAGPMLPEKWRVVGVLEAVNGMLLIGWSTAFLFKVLDHLLGSDGHDHPLPRGAIARTRRDRVGPARGQNSAD